MATRALIGYLDDSNNEFVGTYNHYDGYPDGLGKTLVKFFNSKDAASKLARTGYISSIDPDSGKIDSKYKEKPYYKLIDTDEAFTAGMMIGDAVDYFGGDYGYIWVGDKWLTLENNGVEGMAKQIEDELGELGGFMVDESKKEDIMEQGYEAKWAKFINESASVDFAVLKNYIEQETNYDGGAINAYIESLKNSFDKEGSGYDDYEMDDYVEDFENYVRDKADS